MRWKLDFWKTVLLWVSTKVIQTNPYLDVNVAQFSNEFSTVTVTDTLLEIGGMNLLIAWIIKKSKFRYFKTSPELRPWSDQGATQAGCGVRLAVWGCRSATSTHETISSSIEPPLSLSGANYWAHRLKLRQQSDASSHSPDSTAAYDNRLNPPSITW